MQVPGRRYAGVDARVRMPGCRYLGADARVRIPEHGAVLLAVASRHGSHSLRYNMAPEALPPGPAASRLADCEPTANRLPGRSSDQLPPSACPALPCPALLSTRRALKTKGNTPKYGLIFHSSFIGRAKQRNKGRIRWVAVGGLGGGGGGP